MHLSRSSLVSWTFGLSGLLSLPAFALADMNTLSSPFTVEVNGAPIAKVADDAGDSVHAETGEEAATFTLSDGCLKSGDWILGRPVKEDRSFLPKQVLWFKEGEMPAKMIQPVTAHQEGDSYVVKFGNAPLITEDGKLFADVQGEGQSDVIVKMQ